MSTKRSASVIVLTALTIYGLGKGKQLDNSDSDFDDNAVVDIPVIVEVDDRVLAVEEYFKKWDLPLAEYAETFVEVADENGLDFRLLPAIAMIESTGGKRCLGNNPFGFLYRDFENFDEAIRYVGKAIAGKSTHRAWKEGMTTEEILWVYNGTVNPNYPSKVLSVMERIEEIGGGK